METRCAYCDGRLVIVDGQPFIEFPADEDAHGAYSADLEPHDGGVCCYGPYDHTPRGAWEHAAGYHD